MKPRYLFVDTVRGFALLIMFVFHFAFDLDFFGATRVDFQAPFWAAYRTLILTLFLGVVGASVALTERTWPQPARVLRLAICAALISAGTRLLFPGAWVFFGVLHFVLLASLLTPPLARHPTYCFFAGAFLLALPQFARSPLYDGGLAQLTGLSVELPRTIDFVPLCPWLGVVLLGIFLGNHAKRFERLLRRGEPRLAKLGRHSLFFYMAHQAVLLPLAWIAARLLR